MLKHHVKGGARDFYPYKIDQSLRFNDDDSAYLSRTPGVAGNRKTWTFSTLIKRGSVDTQQFIFATTQFGQSDYINLFFTASGQIALTTAGSTNIRLVSNALYRDPSAYYHIVVTVDTTEPTSTDRVNISVNGTAISSFSGTVTYPPLNYDTPTNNTVEHFISGVENVGGAFAVPYDGLVAETHLTDGVPAPNTDFGEFKNGVWIPKAYTGSYGTNGFHLDFANPADIGNDVSGNNNDWTATNLASTDVVLDSPTNNFCTLNPLDVYTSDLPVFSEGNLKFEVQLDGQIKSTFAADSGQIYWEIYNSGDNNMCGLVKESVAQNNTYGGQMDARVSYGSEAAANSVIRFKADLDAGTFEYAIDGGAFTTTGITGSLTVGETYQVCMSRWNVANATDVINFGQDSSFAGALTAQGNTDANGIGDFYYAPPDGYLALCTSNLTPIPTPYAVYVSPSTENEYFEGTYTGNGSADGPFVYLGFKPTDIVIDGTHYAAGHADFDFNANGVKLRSATTQNTSSTTYTIEAWVDEDFKYANAGVE